MQNTTYTPHLTWSFCSIKGSVRGFTVYMVKDSIHINAPIARCFLLSTNIELVVQTLGLRPVSGKTTGNLLEGDQILWRGWAFGFPQVHESLITKYHHPTFFQDTMKIGRYKRFQLDHHFAEVDGHTFLHDKLRFSLPLGWPGKIVARHVMVPHIARLLRRRFTLLKQVAESEEWRRYVPDGTR